MYFEDTIAKCILFKTAEQRYGTKANDYNIGELRQVVVPYTLSLINRLTGNKINFYKIWKNQQVSSVFSDFIYNLMKEVNQFILENSPGTHYIEWAKKEDCWEKVKNNDWSIDLSLIKDDLIDENNPPKRTIESDIEDLENEENKKIVKSIPYALWNEIGIWGKESGYFDIIKQSIVANIAKKLNQNKKLANEECQKGIEILDIVAKYNEELLQKSEEYIGIKGPRNEVKRTVEEKNELINGLIRNMLTFNQDKEILKEEEVNFLYDILNGINERNHETYLIVFNCKNQLEKKGFKV